MPDIHFSSSAGSTMRLDGTSPTDDPAFRHRREWTQDPPDYTLEPLIVR
jgi:hypothetical protein